MFDKLFDLFLRATSGFWSGMHPAQDERSFIEPVWTTPAPDLNTNPDFLLGAMDRDIVYLDGKMCSVQEYADQSSIFLTTVQSEAVMEDKDPTCHEYLWVHVRHTDENGTGARWERQELIDAIKKGVGYYFG